MKATWAALIVVGILICIFVFVRKTNSSRETRCLYSLCDLRDVCKTYYIENRKYPESLETVINKRLLELGKDRCPITGAKYKYYKISTLGRDGIVIGDSVPHAYLFSTENYSFEGRCNYIIQKDPASAMAFISVPEAINEWFLGLMTPTNSMRSVVPDVVK